MDLQHLSDDELDQHRRDVLSEIERRENLERIPVQITELKHKYAELGGDPTNLE